MRNKAADAEFKINVYTGLSNVYFTRFENFYINENAIWKNNERTQ